MTLPIISIIVPVYNTERYLSECLNSIIKQTYQNLEIVIVDDASTDNSCRIIAEFQRQDDRIKCFRHEKNGGISRTRNTGLKHSTGAYIAWCDSDDVLHPQYIEYLYSILIKEDADFVECQSVSDYEFSSSAFHEQFDATMVVGDRIDFLQRYATHQLQTSLWSKLLKRELFDDFCFPIGRIYEENYFYVAVHNRVNRAAYSSATLYFYRKRMNSIMNTFRLRELKEGLKLIDLFITFPKEYSDEIKLLFRQRSLRILLGYWQRIAMMPTSISNKIRYNKLVVRFMGKICVTSNDISSFTRKERFIYKYRNNTFIFIAYLLFRKYIKRSI